VDRPTLRVVQALAGSASPTGEGLGQGFAHVPILATLYLAPALRAAGPSLIVYADDLLVVARTPEEVSEQLARIHERLLRLRLEVRTSGPALCDRLNFLSTCIRPTPDGGLEPDLSNDCIDQLESLPAEARGRRRAGLSTYLDGLRKLCSRKE